MFKLLKKKKRQKEKKKMDENYTERTNYDNNNDTVDQILRNFDDAYKALRTEYNQIKAMYSYEKEQSAFYKNKIQVRDVMVEILPIISDIKNDVIDKTDLDELKRLIRVRYKQLFEAFSRAGIEIKAHERYQEIDPNERINGLVKQTTDPSLDQKVASSKMGCVIKGEEKNPILEEVEIYVFKKGETPYQPHNTDEYVNEKKDQVYSSCSKDSEYSHPYDELKPQYEDCKTTADPKDMKIDAIICDQGKYVQFDAPVKLIKQSSACFFIISQKDSIAVNEWKKVDVPQVYIDQEKCIIYFGTNALSMEFSLQNMDLYYRVLYNEDNNSLILEFCNNTTKKVFVQHQLTFMTR